jgi:hypothetical protein
MLEMVNQLYTDGNITDKQTQGLIVCIPKTPKPIQPTDYRPLTLLNSDTKLLTRVIANRLSPRISTPQPEPILWNTRKHDPTGRNYRMRRNCLRRTNKNANVHIIPRFQGGLRQYIPQLYIQTPTNIWLQHPLPTMNTKAVQQRHVIYTHERTYIRPDTH